MAVLSNRRSGAVPMGALHRDGRYGSNAERLRAEPRRHGIRPPITLASLVRRISKAFDAAARRGSQTGQRRGPNGHMASGRRDVSGLPRRGTRLNLLPRRDLPRLRDTSRRLGRPTGRYRQHVLIGTGIQVANGEEVVDGDTPIFVDGIACWAREARFGGVVVQPVAGWLSPPFPVATESQRKTLAEFEYDGRAVLDFLIAASPWGSIDQAIASLSVFAHPDVVAATGHRAIFRTVRGRMADRGSIIDGVMVDDNASPAAAFEWSTGLKRGTTRDLTCCHLYASSSDPDAYTDLRNIFYAPSFIAKLTDSQAGSLPVMHALHALRYRAFALHGYCGPGSTARPLKPEHYDSSNGPTRWGPTRPRADWRPNSEPGWPISRKIGSPNQWRTAAGFSPAVSRIG